MAANADAAVTDLDDGDRADRSTVTRIESRCPAGRDVVLYRVNEGGHRMPGAPDARFPRLANAFLGPQNHDIDGAEIIWAFLQEVSVTAPLRFAQWRAAELCANRSRHSQEKRKDEHPAFRNRPRMSQVVVNGNTVYLAGVVANKAKGKSTTEQTQEILAIIDGHLAKAGTDKSKLLSTNIYITDMKNFAEMNRGVGQVGVARQHAGPRHRRGKARRPRLPGRDHGGRGQVGTSTYGDGAARR
jgi:enamine deaminase RidA (YjgF/YER057c/UK114 family)